jgi:hypothetical protein
VTASAAEAVVVGARLAFILEVRFTGEALGAIHVHPQTYMTVQREAKEPGPTGHTVSRLNR